MKMIQKILISGLIIVLFGCGQRGPLLLNDQKTQVNTNQQQAKSKLAKQEITPIQTKNTDDSEIDDQDKGEEKDQ